jgi:hypothetical protein
VWKGFKNVGGSKPMEITEKSMAVSRKTHSGLTMYSDILHFQIEDFLQLHNLMVTLLPTKKNHSEVF